MADDGAYPGLHLPIKRPDLHIALALGGGGARGLSHILVLEAFDDLGVKPTVMAGTSIGALIGAAYASGLSGAEIRDHVMKLFGDRRELARKVMQTRSGKFIDLFQSGINGSVMIDPVRLLAQLLPSGVALDFKDLEIPFTAVATDFWSRAEARMSDGPLITAIGASIAIPSVLKPVIRDGRVLIDGGAANPLPFDLFDRSVDICVAVDVTGGPVRKDKAKHPAPGPFEAMFGTLQIMMTSIVNEKLKGRHPDILIRPDVDRFKVLDFLKAGQILKAAEPIKDETKRRLERLLEAA
ncbi:MAG TPA: patatin-like phospholipase family protein [Kaistiaceae bacterium]|nr:patatin-like phospholipase family protein [Kaistiaceae bacterium]